MFNIVPQPVSMLTNSSRKGFTLHAGTTISDFSFAKDFKSFIRNYFDKKIHLHEEVGEEKAIVLKIDENMEHEEGYKLLCADRRVEITAKTETGLFYGLQTLRQMLVQKNGKLPYTEIEDYPRFSHRGLYIDFGKNLYSVEDLKKIIDLMAAHKLNVLRLRFSDKDYTQEALEEIVKYCSNRKNRLVNEDENLSAINTNQYPYRFDYPYGVNTLKKVCNDDGELADCEETVGIEACIWTEYIPNMEKLEYLLFPRLGAMAENAWAEKGYPSFTTFVYKSTDYLNYLNAYDVNYAKIKKACPSFMYKYATVVGFECRKIFGKKRK